MSVNPALILTREMLSRTGRAQCRVVSKSMEPVLRVGQLISLEKIDSLRALSRFDIIAFLYGEDVFCHFVWHCTAFDGEEKLTTRSLADPWSNDVPILFEHVLGRVVVLRISRWTRARILLVNVLRRTV